MRRIVRFDNERQIAAYLAGQWRGIAEQAVEKRGYWTIALSGGLTPVAVYRQMAKISRDVPWDKAHIFTGDERFVTYRSGRSNFGMIRRVLLEPLRVRRDRMHPVPIGKTPGQSARAYEKELRLFFRRARHRAPCFDIMVLGVGEDGHTAALFPGDGALREKKRLVMPVRYPHVENERITVTFPVINNARHVFILATGTRKKPIVPMVIARLRRFPASRVNPVRGALTFVLDKRAASLL